MEKLCPTCGELKLILQFSRNKNRKDGLQRECKVCCKAHHDKHYYSKKSPTRFNTPDPEGFKTCTECKVLLTFENYSKLKQGKFGLASRCKACTAQKHKEWRNSTGRAWENEYTKKRKKTDPEYRIKFILRLRLLDAIKRHTTGGKVNKQHSALTLLGCTVEAAVTHIQSQFLPEMTWENHGSVWEIDHIKPCSAFNLQDVEEQRTCFNYKNLQPLFITSAIAEKFGYKNYKGNRNKSNS